MDSIKNILDPKKFAEEPEAVAIKRYIQNTYQTPSNVLVQDNQIIITVPSAALAGTLQQEQPKIKELCQTKKKLFIRIGF